MANLVALIYNWWHLYARLFDAAHHREAITMVSSTLQRINTIAERWTVQQRWTLLLTHILRHWLGGKWLGQLPPQAAQILSG